MDYNLWWLLRLILRLGGNGSNKCDFYKFLKNFLLKIRKLWFLFDIIN